MANITVFSLDYDGCGEVLFPEMLHTNEFTIQDVTESRKHLKNFFQEKIKASGEEKPQVELYVGSNRQSQHFNRINKLNNKNGDCFSNYAKYAEDNNWTFKPLLLADVRNNQATGSAISNPGLECEFDKLKIETLKYQIKDIAKNHPNDTIDLYFLDDDASGHGILSALEKKLKKVKFPSNITVHLVKYDWFGGVVEKKPFIDESIAPIKGTRNVNAAFSPAQTQGLFSKSETMERGPAAEQSPQCVIL